MKRPRGGAAAARSIEGACFLAWLDAPAEGGAAASAAEVRVGELHFSNASHVAADTPLEALYGVLFELRRRADGLWTHEGGDPFRVLPLGVTVAAQLSAARDGGGVAWALADADDVAERLEALGAPAPRVYAPPEPPAPAAVVAGLDAWLACGERRSGWDLSRIPADERTSEQMLAGPTNPLLTLFCAAAAHAPLARKASAAAIESRFEWRTSLCSYFAWAVPTDAALSALAALGPLLELGAGTGYWAALLAARGADVAAYDAAGSHEGQWFRFRAQHVRDGGPEQAAAPEHAHRALLLCWPDIVGDSAADDADRGSFGADCLAAFRGDVVAHIGELGPAVARAKRGYGDVFPPGGSTSSAALQRALRAGFECVQTVKLPNWPPYNSHLTIWRRNAGAAAGSKKASAAAAVPRAPRAAAPAEAADVAYDVEWLLAPEGLSSFAERSWCAAPALLRATPARTAAAAACAALPALLSIAGEGERESEDEDAPLRFGRDVCASLYAGGARRDAPAAQCHGAPARAAQLRALLAEGYTLQVHQPQRFCAPLWRLCAALERSFGALVGANVYVTPPGCQGLAPHYDDVDVFVLHTQGTKSWRVYPQLQGHARPRAHSDDLPRAALAPPAMEVTLHPGDVLYLPRGTPHEAVAGGAKRDQLASCHVTLSTYQRWDAGDLASHALSWLLDGAPPGSAAYAAAAPLRAPLPRGIAFQAPGVAMAAAAAAALRVAADAVEAHAAAASAGALDALAADFMASRLPPPPPEAPRGPLPGPRDAIAAAAPGCARIATAPHGRTVALVTCQGNDRAMHMMGASSDDDSSSDSGSSSADEEEEEEEEEDEEEGSEGESDDDDGAMTFPADHAAALRAVLAAVPPRGIAVADLPLDGPPAAKLALARALWAAGAARTLPAGDGDDAPEAPPRKRAAGRK